MATAVVMTLQEYFGVVLRKPWAPGTWDCSTFMADWVANMCVGSIRSPMSGERILRA
jgi:hypothetical protein